MIEEVRVVDHERNKIVIKTDGIDSVRVIAIDNDGTLHTMTMHKSIVDNVRAGLAIAAGTLPKLDADGAFFIDADEFRFETPPVWMLEEAARVDAAMMGAPLEGVSP